MDVSKFWSNIVTTLITYTVNIASSNIIYFHLPYSQEGYFITSLSFTVLRALILGFSGSITNFHIPVSVYIVYVKIKVCKYVSRYILYLKETLNLENERKVNVFFF